MNMFGLEGSGFIIAISVSLLLVGAVVYYFNTRVASLEKALVRQNQVLADFIQNVKTSHIQERNMQMQVADDSLAHGAVANGATQEAVDAARDYFSEAVPQEKVDVSDDEEYSSSEGEDSELESDIEDSVENISEEVDSGSSGYNGVRVEQLSMSQDPTILGAMLVDMTGMYPVDSVVETKDHPVVELLDDEDIKEVSNKLAPVEVKNEETEDKKVIKLSDVDDLDVVSSSLGSSLDDDEDEEDDGVTIDSKQENVIADYSKLKVAKLKELASKHGIKNAAKMKKAELVAALEAKK